MQERPESNSDLKRRGGIFEVFNQYFLLFFALCCIFSSVFVQELFISLQQYRLGISVAPFLGIVLPIFLLTRQFPTSFARQLRIRRPGLTLTLYVTLATIAMVAVVDHVYVISQQFMPEPEAYLDTLKMLKPSGILPTALTFVGLCIVIPIAEEVVFRGIIQRVFERNMGGIVALLLAGTFFGVLHFNPQLLLSMTSFGIFVGFIFYATSNLTYTILAHAVLNTVAFVQLTFGSGDDLGTAPFYLQDWWYLPLALAVVVILMRETKKKGEALPTPTPGGGHDDH